MLFRSKPTANPPITQPEPKKSLTINHKPLTNNKTKISDNFVISGTVAQWAYENNYKQDALEKHRKYFVLACKSQGYEKESWDDFFIKAIVDNWAKLPNPKGGVVV